MKKVEKAQFQTNTEGHTIVVTDWEFELYEFNEKMQANFILRLRSSPFQLFASSLSLPSVVITLHVLQLNACLLNYVMKYHGDGCFVLFRKSKLCDTDGMKHWQ